MNRKSGNRDKLIPGICILATMIFLPLAAAAGIQWQEEVLEPPQGIDNYIYLKDSALADHFFTTGRVVTHYFFIDDRWEWEIVDSDLQSAGEISGFLIQGQMTIVYTIDGGFLRLAQWTGSEWTTETLPTPDMTPALPVVVSQSTNLVVVFQDHQQSSRLIMMEQVNGTWAEPVILDDEGDCGYYLQGAVSTDDRIHLLYQAAYPYYDLRHAIIVDGQVQISTVLEQGDQGRYIHLTAGPGEQLHLCGLDGWNNNLMYGIYDPYGGWSFETVDPEWGSGTVSGIWISPEGVVRILSVQPENNTLHQYEKSGSGWVKDLLEQFRVVTLPPQMKTNEYGGMDAGIWSEPRTISLGFSGNLHLVTETAGIWHWETVVDILSSVYKSAVFYDPDQKPIIVVDDYPNVRIYRKKGDLWDLQLIGRGYYYPNESSLIRPTQAVIDSNGTIHIATCARYIYPTENVVEYWQIKDGCVTKERVSNDFRYPQIVLDAQERPHIFFSSSTGDTFQAHRTDEGIWSIEQIWEDEDFDWYEVILSKGSGLMTMLKKQYDDPHITLGHYNGSVWHLERIPAFDHTTIDDWCFNLSASGRPILLIKLNAGWYLTEPGTHGWTRQPALDFSMKFQGLSAELNRLDHPVVLVRKNKDYQDYKLEFWMFNGISWAGNELMPLDNDITGTYALGTKPSFDSTLLPAVVMDDNNGFSFYEFKTTGPEAAVRVNTWDVQAGDPFKAEYQVWNDGNTARYDLLLLLEVPVGDSSLFFSAPDWRSVGQEFSTITLTLQAGETIRQTLFDFQWPAGAGTGTAGLWTILLDPENASPVSDLSWDFWNYR